MKSIRVPIPFRPCVGYCALLVLHWSSIHFISRIRFSHFCLISAPSSGGGAGLASQILLVA